MTGVSDLSTRTVLQLGSGQKYRNDAVNVDVVTSTRPDLVHDLNILPWPFESDRFTEVVAYDVIEHLDDIVRTMEEIHRVCKSNATVKLTVPHFSCANAYVDPTHRHVFSVFSFQYFTGDNEFSFYTDRRFRTIHANIIFRPTLLNRLVRRLAERNLSEYERRWAWMFPAWFVHVELQVHK
jgi:SAM-dependent methyltransferase